MPATLAELQEKAEEVFYTFNRQRRMIVRAVLNMRKRARKKAGLDFYVSMLFLKFILWPKA